MAARDSPGTALRLQRVCRKLVGALLQREQLAWSRTKTADRKRQLAEKNPGKLVANYLVEARSDSLCGALFCNVLTR
jgi:hypothetical protein